MRSGRISRRCIGTRSPMRCARSDTTLTTGMTGGGRDLGFEIRGVSQDLQRTYSQRSQQRDQAIEAFTEQTGRRPTDNEVAILVRESRPDKLMEISPAEVKHRQLVRLTPAETQSLTELRQQAVEIAHERKPLGL